RLRRRVLGGDALVDEAEQLQGVPAPAPPVLGEDAGDAVRVAGAAVSAFTDRAGHPEGLAGAEHVAAVVLEQPAAHGAGGPGMGPEPRLPLQPALEAERLAPRPMGEEVPLARLPGGGLGQLHALRSARAGRKCFSFGRETLGCAAIPDGALTMNVKV